MDTIIFAIFPRKNASKFKEYEDLVIILFIKYNYIYLN